jgi:dTDP-4-dehydrorhamnose 3,5-epimerase
MNLIQTPLDGCFEIRPRIFQDDRGKLVKTFHHDTFESLGLRTDFKEEYYSLSSKRVLRGLHFQIPPHDHVKCVTCLEGAIFDVALDLRKDSPTYLKHYSLELNSDLGNMLYIPSGFAHGFYVMSEQALFLNRTTSVFNAESDAGVRWDSCGIEWPDPAPVLSEKDQQMIELKDFKSPF